MMTKSTSTLKTERLCLRQLKPDDAKAMYHNWASDPAVTTYLTWQPHQDLNVTRASLIWRQEQYHKENYFDWGIELVASHELIGTITVVHQEHATACAEIGYCLGQRWWSHGYATEALVSVINFLFSSTSFKRIEAKHDTKNPASGKVMQKAGLQYEGTLRQHGLNNTGICDEAIYAIVRSDWAAANNL